MGPPSTLGSCPEGAPRPLPPRPRPPPCPLLPSAEGPDGSPRPLPHCSSLSTQHAMLDQSSKDRVLRNVSQTKLLLFLFWLKSSMDRRLRNSTLRYTPKRNENIYLHRSLYLNVYKQPRGRTNPHAQQLTNVKQDAEQPRNGAGLTPRKKKVPTHATARGALETPGRGKKLGGDAPGGELQRDSLFEKVTCGQKLKKIESNSTSI